VHGNLFRADNDYGKFLQQATSRSIAARLWMRAAVGHHDASSFTPSASVEVCAGTLYVIELTQPTNNVVGDESALIVMHHRGPLQLDSVRDSARSLKSSRNRYNYPGTAAT
jgi:hypothetical protein